MRSIVIAAAFILVSGAAWAGELIEGRCHMMECTWFAIEQKDLIGTSDKGDLFKVITKTWGATYPDGNYGVKRPRKYLGEDTSFAFCSKTEPATINLERGKYYVSPLPLGQEGIQAGVYMTSIAYYFAVCHSMNVKQSDVFRTGTTKARELGYVSVDPERSEFQVMQVGDLLTPPAEQRSSPAPAAPPAPAPSAKSETTPQSKVASERSENKQDTKRKLDLALPTYTEGYTGACPIDLIFSPLQKHSADEVLSALTSVLYRSSRLEKIGCSELREGVRVYGRKEGSGLIFFSLSEDGPKTLFTLEYQLRN